MLLIIDAQNREITYIFFFRWTHGCTRFNYNGVEAIIVAGGRISAGRGDELNSAEILGKTVFQNVFMLLH